MHYITTFNPFWKLYVLLSVHLFDHLVRFIVVFYSIVVFIFL